MNKGRWKPGQSGNPGGRAKGAESRFRVVVSERTYKAKDGKEYTGIDALAQVLLDIAFSSDEASRDRIQAASKYVDRGWGSVKQTVELTSDGRAADTSDFDPETMTDEEIREGLEAIGTLKRLGAMTDGDGPTEH